VLLLQVIANVVPSLPIVVTQMTEAIRSSETSVLPRATRRHIPEDGIQHKECLLAMPVVVIFKKNISFESQL
jgi:hypothetical protein